MDFLCVPASADTPASRRKDHQYQCRRFGHGEVGDVDRVLRDVDGERVARAVAGPIDVQIALKVTGFAGLGERRTFEVCGDNIVGYLN